jgi:hypothetical protein
MQNFHPIALQFILKLVTAADAPRGFADPQILLDYRCYLLDGKEEIGTDYPPQIRQCLAKISSMSVKVCPFSKTHQEFYDHQC